jgi:hypothetical protein
MSTGKKFAAWWMASFLCLVSFSALASASAHSQRKAKKPAVPPLPSGPQGPVPHVPLDSIPAVAPQVIYQSGQLSILAPNSSLGDILRAIRKQTAAEIEIPANANERVVTNLGPGPARDVVAELLNGSRFNYVLLGSPSDASRLTRVVLVAKTGPDAIGANGQPAQPAGVNEAGITQVGNMAPLQQDAGTAAADAPEAEAAEENADDSNTDQSAEVEQQQVAPPEPPGGIKTPQQMLQEMQQRQLQMQQQQQAIPGQPIPGVPLPPQRPPQEP